MVATDDIKRLLESARTIAVIGMKPSGAAHGVPVYMEGHGYKIIPVNPHYDTIDDRACVDSVDQIDDQVDIVNVFRRSQAVEDHVDEILALSPHPEAVWLQLGIRNDRAARRLREAGITVVQDRCIKVDHSRYMR